MTDGNDTPSTTDGNGGPAAHRDPPADEEALVARVEEYNDEPSTCTIYPADADDWVLLTTWVSADVDGFVALDEMQ